jgi:hypothetical protein
MAKVNQNVCCFWTLTPVTIYLIKGFEVLPIKVRRRHVSAPHVFVNGKDKYTGTLTKKPQSTAVLMSFSHLLRWICFPDMWVRKKNATNYNSYVPFFPSDHR